MPMGASYVLMVAIVASCAAEWTARVPSGETRCFHIDVGQPQQLNQTTRTDIAASWVVLEGGLLDIRVKILADGSVLFDKEYQEGSEDDSDVFSVEQRIAVISSLLSDIERQVTHHDARSHLSRNVFGSVSPMVWSVTIAQCFAIVLANVAMVLAVSWMMNARKK
eukprot:m51a1_g5411 putative C-tail anchored protein (165) ;mRNA; r:89482-90321